MRRGQFPTTTTTRNTAAAPAVTTPPATTQPAAPATTTTQTQAQNNKPATMEELPSFVPAPKSLMSENAAADVADCESRAPLVQSERSVDLRRSDQTAPPTSRWIRSWARVVWRNSALQPADDVMKVGEKRRYAIQLNSDIPLSLALLTLKFDPKVVKVHAVTAGKLVARRLMQRRSSHRRSTRVACA